MRIRPLPELPVKVTRVDATPQESLAVYDVSIGGLGLVTAGGLRATNRDQAIRLSVDVGRYGAFEVEARVRHVGITITGAEFVEPAPIVTTALGRYLAELLERGAFS